MNDLINKMIEDYTKEDITYCGECNTPRGFKLELLGQTRIMPINCKCRNERLRLEEKLEVMRQNEERRRAYIHNKRFCGYRFSNSEDSAELQKAKEYCKKWKQMYKENIGLLLHGDVGTGKTRIAACIANELIDQQVSVRMTGVPYLIEKLSNFKDDGREDFLEKLNKVSLLIIDDLGVERQTSFAEEKLYSIIDGRYNSDKPLIITTNLTIDELRNPANITQSRIYSRVLEMCTPMPVTGENRRKGISADKSKQAKKILLEG